MSDARPPAASGPRMAGPLPFLLALTLGLALVGAAAWGIVGMDAPAAPERTAQPLEQAQQERAAASERSWDVPFDSGMVQDRSDYRDVLTGSDARDLTVINATPGADLEATAAACAEAEISDVAVGNCYVFTSQESYEVQNLYEEQRANPAFAGTGIQIANLCYAASATVRPDAVTVADVRQTPKVWDSWRCPSGWEGER